MSESVNWQPSAPMSNLLKRASMLADVRRFFADRGVLEVETPAMSQTTLADVYQFPFQLEYQGCDDCESQKLYLVTNPEYHMKRLLAAGSGPIFQLGRSFRNKDADSRHNPEFTILEWYRPCFDMYRLMNEVDDLLQQILDSEPAESLSYQQAFLRHLDIDPLSADKAVLAELVEAKGLTDQLEGEERDCLLHVLFQREVVPNLGQEKPVFVYHFPANQAELAQISSEDHRVAERFQVFYHAMELADGFHELSDIEELRKRLEQENIKRAARNLPTYPIDERLMAAVAAGMPDCSGVALGVERLLMVAVNAEDISEVMAFPVSIA